MHLALKELAPLFPKARGARENLLILTVTDDPETPQPKGLYIPADGETNGLNRAIANGAIAAVWRMDIEIPPYTPNHFPLFFTSDMEKAVKNILEYYLEKLDGETDTKMDMTNFIFLNKKLLNKNNESYDIAGLLNQLPAKGKRIDQLGRG